METVVRVIAIHRQWLLFRSQEQTTINAPVAGILQ